MRFKTLVPSGVVLDREVGRIRIDAKDGSRTFLPNHADFVTAVVPGLVSFTPSEDPDTEVFMACDRGILVKEGETVSLSVRRAVVGSDLAVLTKAIGAEFKKVEEERKTVNAAMARLEVGLTRGLMQLNSRRQ